MAQGFDSQLPSDKAIYDKSLDRKPPKPPGRQSLPSGLFILALFCILIGASGVWFTIPGVIEDIQGKKEESFDSFYLTFKQEIKNMPVELQSRYGNVVDENLLKALFNNGSAGMKKYFPNLWMYQVFSIAFSLLSLIGGIGVFMRKNWGRQSLIALFVSSTLIISLAGYVIIPDAMKFVADLIAATGTGNLLRMDLNAFSKTAMNVWTIMVVTFVLLHGSVVYYLYTREIRQIFIPESLPPGRYFS